jgi:hypothetical protein
MAMFSRLSHTTGAISRKRSSTARALRTASAQKMSSSRTGMLFGMRATSHPLPGIL